MYIYIFGCNEDLAWHYPSSKRKGYIYIYISYGILKYCHIGKLDTHAASPSPPSSPSSNSSPSFGKGIAAVTRVDIGLTNNEVVWCVLRVGKGSRSTTAPLSLRLRRPCLRSFFSSSFTGVRCPAGCTAIGSTCTTRFGVPPSSEGEASSPTAIGVLAPSLPLPLCACRAPSSSVMVVAVVVRVLAGVNNT